MLDLRVICWCFVLEVVRYHGSKLMQIDRAFECFSECALLWVPLQLTAESVGKYLKAVNIYNFYIGQLQPTRSFEWHYLSRPKFHRGKVCGFYPQGTALIHVVSRHAMPGVSGILEGVMSKTNLGLVQKPASMFVCSFIFYIYIVLC